MEEHRRASRLVVLVTAVLTAVVFGVVVLVTGFLACGVSGCGGGGFGPSFAPAQAQAGLLAAGLCVVPLVLVSLMGRRGRWWLVAAAATALVVGSLLAMALLDLGLDGCPTGQSRVEAGAGAFVPGSSTCSGDPDALPPSASL